MTGVLAAAGVVVIAAAVAGIVAASVAARRRGDEHDLPFRQRCGWCGVRLRGWQPNLCAMCGPAVRSSDFRSSPCPQYSRLNEPADVVPWRRR